MSGRTHVGLRVSVVFTFAWAASIAHADLLPGTPLNGASFGIVDITYAGQVLLGPVQPGDVVLREIPNPPGTNARSNWSDVVRFTNLQTSDGTIGLAFLVSDSETGINDISIEPLLPDTLAANNVFLNETQVGTGTDNDVTPYSVPGGVYNVHSDAALPVELPSGPVTIDPGAPINGGQHFRRLIEFGVDIPGAPLGFLAKGGTCDVTEPAGAGVNTVCVAPGGAPLGGAVSDFLMFQANGVAGKSDPPDINDVDNPGPDFELVNQINGGVGGEFGYTTYLVTGPDIPEPSCLLLIGTGLLAMGARVYFQKTSPVEAGSPHVRRPPA